jgi:PAS domain S-box-containing protein
MAKTRSQAGVRSVIELSTYRLELLWSDKELNLYRGSSEHNGAQILVLSPAAEYPAPEILQLLEKEYSLRGELDPAWAARPIEIAYDGERIALLSEDPGGIPLDRLLGEPLDLAFWLHLAVGLASAIDGLHQRGIIHKDIKPGNVLADAVTGRCWLKGFGIASRLPRERQSAKPPELVAGTLAYMAPEQTGRMNRSIDRRSDLYALGVSLYEMLTGTLPFTASDPMEWVHCHIAREPISPSERLARVPTAVSAIVMKLLAKTAEERYQTAAGVGADLRRCLDALGLPRAQSGRTPSWPSDPTGLADVLTYEIDEFSLGEFDIPDQLLIPEKLYGRTREIHTLLDSFERVVASGRPEFVLVSGYSGIGKSSVVNELHKVLVPPRGLFASGKFDQYKRDIPYSTLAQASQGLIRPLLVRSEGELRRWRDLFQEALGPNGQLMVDLVPELALIIGQQPPVPELATQEAQGRFQLVFRRFLNVFAQAGHPVALFLDDLQWLDAATLDLLESLSTQSDVQHLLVIGAYRDNEVDRTHPLVRKVESIRQAGAIVREITLTPLSCEDLGQLIGDSLHCGPENESAGVTQLAELVHEKTGGNPFFAIQFLSGLADEGLLTFDHSARRWSWDLTRIHAKGYTDNVVELMVGKLNRLPVETRETLKEFACLGSSAQLNTLSIVHGASEENVQSDLWEALRLEFVVRSEGTYKFVHDRIQEAAYSLIPDELRAETHLRIGRLLFAQAPPDQLEEAVFEIVSQLNRGALLISSPEEREHLAELNLLAGKRAKASTAYSSALKYFIAGTALLPSDLWQSRHELAFALELYRAECEFLTGALRSAEERLAMLSSHAGNLVDRATVTHLQEELFTTLGRSDRAIEVCLDYLLEIGVQWSAHPAEDEVEQEYERLRRLIGTRSIEHLVDLPPMTEPKWRATMDVLTAVVSSALFTDKNLLCLVICRMANLSLEHGNCDGSCFAYVWLGMLLGPRFGDYQAGFRFGKLGLDLVEQCGLRRYEARVCLIFGHRVIPWTQPIRNGRALVQRAFDVANRLGDLTFAAYSCDNRITNLLASGDPLAGVELEADAGLEFARRSRFGLVIDRITTQVRLIRTLRGLTGEFGSFNDTEFDELRFERHLSEEPELAIAACWYWIRKLQARFLAGAYASALVAAVNAERLLWTSPSFWELAEYHLYAALTRAALCDSASSPERAEHLEALAAHHRQLQEWADNCPENFANRAALAAAEIARIEGRDFDAMRLYERAIRSANANGFVHNEAVVSELAARFYLEHGFDLVARAYLRKARYDYLRWGADGKVRQLDDSFPYLREEQGSSPTNTIGAPIEHLDLATVIKVSQAVSGEIVLEKLIDTLMRTALEHAGGSRGLLLLPQANEFRIEAEVTTGQSGIQVRLCQAPATSMELPEAILRYVIRVRDSVILDDALAPNPYSADSYILSQRPRSVLCLPLQDRTRLAGVLYLENNLSAHVFSPARIALLRLLASQAAISLENARLYTELEGAEQRAREGERQLRQALDSIPALVWSTGPDGSSEVFNKQWHDFTGLSPVEGANGGWRRTFHPDDFRKVLEKWLEILASGQPAEIEARMRRCDGTYRSFLVRATPLRDDFGNVMRWYGTSTDIEDLKQTEAELRRRETDLREAQAVLAHVSRVATMGELTASIAHEVNQPLSAALNNASACVRWLAANDFEEAQRAASLVISNVHRAGEIIAGIRALAKKAPPQKEPLDINETILEAVAMVRNALLSNRVSSEAELANDLPLITGDRVQLQQVILNLLINAIEAMAESEAESRLLWVSSKRTTEVSNHSEHVLIAVRDSGPGLDMNSLNRLFDTFYTTKPQGLGMGLAISRSIVEAHGGRLWATQNPDAGATFQFILPVQSQRGGN